MPASRVRAAAPRRWSTLGDITRRGGYIDYIVPGILVMAIGGGGASTTVNISADMAKSIVNRFRTMPISRAAVLTGQVLGSRLEPSRSL